MTASPAVKEAAKAWAAGYRVMLGLDGTSVEDAADQAYTPSGPPREVLVEQIRRRRGVAA